MRTTPEECAELGRILADKVNAYTAPVTVLLPLKGISVISAPGGVFHDTAADRSLFEGIKRHLNENVQVIETDALINDDAFASACVTTLLTNIKMAQAVN